MRRDELRAATLGAITSPDLGRLYDYWQGKHRGELLPGRQEIDPLELRFIMGNLALVEVLREPMRFRYRLMGSKLTRPAGMELTGKLLDEHPDTNFRKLAAGHYTDVATTGRPFATHHDMVLDGRVRRYDVLLLPLAADGRTVDMILVGQLFG